MVILQAYIKSQSAAKESCTEKLEVIKDSFDTRCPEDMALASLHRLYVLV